MPHKSKVFLKKVRIALSPRSSLLRTRLQNGAIVEGYNRSGYGGRGVYVFGDALEPELCYLQHFLSPGKVFVDIGANVGVFAIKAAKEVGEGGLVIAVEPFLETALRLSKNVQANGYRNVRVRNLCIGRTTQHGVLHLNKEKPNSFSLVRNGATRSISVLSASLDDLCGWENVDRLDYLKIDAEGAEAAILEGGKNTIARFRPIVQVEVTIAHSSVAADYRRFSFPGSMNHLFVPQENAHAVETALKFGWAEIQDGQAAHRSIAVEVPSASLSS
jgi:FkbM family methyltransferase